MHENYKFKLIILNSKTLKIPWEIIILFSLIFVSSLLATLKCLFLTLAKFLERQEQKI